MSYCSTLSPSTGFEQACNRTQWACAAGCVLSRYYDYAAGTLTHTIVADTEQELLVFLLSIPPDLL